MAALGAAKSMPVNALHFINNHWKKPRIEESEKPLEVRISELKERLLAKVVTAEEEEDDKLAASHEYLTDLCNKLKGRSTSREVGSELSFSNSISN